MTGNLFPARLRSSHRYRRQNTSFRRNGKLQACEPCRKGKLRCDHMMPSCGRCTRRNKSDKCVYHPAPLTKTAIPRHASLDSNSVVAHESRGHIFDDLVRGTYATTTDRDATRSPCATLSQPLPLISQLSEHNSIPEPEDAYDIVLSGIYRANSLPVSTQEPLQQLRLGQPSLLPTPNHRDDTHRRDNRAIFIDDFAVLTENELGIGIEPSDPGPLLTSCVTESHISSGVTVLTLLQDFQMIQKYIEKWYSFAGGFVVLGPMIKIYTDGIWSTWRKTLDAQPADLKLMSEKIWENTLKPVSRLLDRNTKPRKFCESVTGEFLRWEVVGLIVTLVSLLAQSLKGEIVVSFSSHVLTRNTDGDPIFCATEEVPTDRAELALQMLNASEMCVSFCDDFNVLNDLYLWLLYENSIAYHAMRTRASKLFSYYTARLCLLEDFIGRPLFTSIKMHKKSLYNSSPYTGYETSKKVAAMSAATICFNLHREIKVDDQTPFFITELRKRLCKLIFMRAIQSKYTNFTPNSVICCYANDKRFAISAGRPPSLTRHYCQLQVPLDITDAQLMSEGLELEAAIQDLDKEGWNQHATIQRCTYARLNATNALIAEEILEISLGHLPPDDVVRRTTEIETKTNQCWADLPDFLRINVENPWNSKRSPLELLYLVCIRLGHLEHHFLLQRTISKLSGAGPENSGVKLLSVCDEIFRLVLLMVENKDYFRDFQVDYISMLAVHGVPTAVVLAVELLHQERNPTAISTTAYPLHRSNTIQRLSVFVSCLGSVRSEAYGSQSCERGHTFLKKILDMILGSGPAAVPAEIEPSSVHNLNDPVLGAELLQAGSDADFIQWLESMEWNQDIWVNCN